MSLTILLCSRQQVILIALLLIMSVPFKSQVTKADYYNKIDNTMFLLSKNKKHTFDSIVANVKRLYQKNEDRVRAYYTWIALNIAYDSEHLNSMQKDKNMFVVKDSSQEAKFVFSSKKAVCEGFSKLMNKFCEASGISSQMIVGYTRMPEGQVMTDVLHAWNVVNIDGTWKLLDVTWSNGYVDFYSMYHKHFSDQYFIDNTANFYKDHLPLDPQWQLSLKPVSKDYFFKTDTMNKYFTTTAFNYADSISVYKKQSYNTQQWLDYVHYYRYDRSKTGYLEDADRLIYNNAVTILNDGAMDFQEYQVFYTETLSKANTTTNCKKAKTMLEASKNKDISLLNYLAGQKTFTTKIGDELIIVRKNADDNLALINKHMVFIAKLEKSATAPNNKVR